MNKNKMWDILKKLVSFFEEKEITYWLDSGTLLGFAREGGFLEWDTDIDLAVLSRDFTKKTCLEEFKLLLSNEKYNSYVLLYNGIPCATKFTPKSYADGLVDVGVLFFRMEKNIMWVPGWQIKGKSYSLYDPRYYLYGIFRYPLKKLNWHSNKGKCERDGAELNNFLSNLTGKFTTVVYPQELIKKPVTKNWAPGKVPQRWDEYLNYRYGNWRIPDKDWDCYKDDRAYKSIPPKKALKIYGENPEKLKEKSRN